MGVYSPKPFKSTLQRLPLPCSPMPLFVPMNQSFGEHAPFSLSLDSWACSSSRASVENEGEERVIMRGKRGGAGGGGEEKKIGVRSKRAQQEQGEKEIKNKM